jgi:hypothetical protein
MRQSRDSLGWRQGKSPQYFGQRFVERKKLCMILAIIAGPGHPRGPSKKKAEETGSVSSKQSRVGVQSVVLADAADQSRSARSPDCELFLALFP